MKDPIRYVLVLLVAMPSAVGAGTPVINEIHYANFGQDLVEFVEVAGEAGTDLASYELVFYDGDGFMYRAVSLKGKIANQKGGFGARVELVPDMLDGVAGVALMETTDERVLELLSYGGVFTAQDGPAAGMTSTNIGAEEDPGRFQFSLQRVGEMPTQFLWEGPIPHTPGALNIGQTWVPEASSED